MRKPPLFGFEKSGELYKHLIRQGLDVSRQTIENWDTGGTKPNMRLAREVAVALELTKDEVYAWVMENKGVTI